MLEEVTKGNLYQEKF